MSKTTPRQHSLPWQQLLILAVCRFAEPIALTSVFPYLPEMIESFNVPKADIAKWAGLTSAVFSLSQCLTGILWGRAADRFGRKPVIMIGIVCIMTSCLTFGFSQNLPWAIAARAMGGLSSGNVGIIRTTVAELVPYRNLQPRAFSIMPLVWSIGSVFGPSLGGALANPAAKYPWLFDTPFFRTFPWALPNLVAACFFLVGLTTAFLSLQETIESKKDRPDYGRIIGKRLARFFMRTVAKKPKLPWRQNNTKRESSLQKCRVSSTSSLQDEENVPHTKHIPVIPPSWREVFQYQSNLNLLVYALSSGHSIAYDQLLPVFMHLPTQPNRSTNPDVQWPLKFAGGFGIDSDRIGILFTLYGFFGMTIQFLAFPPLCRKFGVLSCLKASLLLYPFAYILTPFTVLLPTPLWQQIAIFVVLCLKCWAAIFSFPCSTILLTNSAASLRLLGTLNGVATSVSAIGRASAPFIGGLTFTLGIDIGYVCLPWFTLAFIALIGAIPCWWLVEMDGFGGSGDSDSGGEDEDEDEDEAEENEERDAVEPTIRAPRPSFSRRSSRRATNASADDVIVEAPETEDDEDYATENSPLLRVGSQSSQGSRTSRTRRRRTSTPQCVSSPLGMSGAWDPAGPPGSRKLSTSLGLSNDLGQRTTGFGAAGPSYQG